MSSFTDNFSHDLIFGLSEKADGNMKLSSDKFGQQCRENREQFFRRLGLSDKNVISAGWQHGHKVTAVPSGEPGKILSDSDALITDQPGLVLILIVADCLPLYFYDPIQRVIALAHAGWRGIESNIAAAVIQDFIDKYHSRPADIAVFVGPHIKKCHFEVKADVISIFAAYPEAIVNRDGKTYLDLAGVVRRQLLNVGLRENNIDVSSDCTYCLSDKYFSFRRDHPQELEAMLAYMSMV
jgi:YfiH family protein